MSISTLSHNNRESWTPNLAGKVGRRYTAIADAIEEDIASGRLRPGERLPTHRELAWRLNLSVSTVSKAYGLAERRHLIGGEVGRGTFVISRPSELARTEPNRPQSDHIDLSFNSAIVFPEVVDAIADALRAVADRNLVSSLIPYNRLWLGQPEHRAAGVKWIAHMGLTTPIDDVVVVNGAQHAAAALLAALTEPGDTIALEELADPGIRFLAGNRHLKTRPVPLDEHGLIPEALEGVCRDASIKVLFCIPNHHSPTLAVMPIERRKEIAQIAVRYNVMVIENDVCGCFLDKPLPPIASFAPEQCFYVTSQSKVIAPGLRVGFIATPPGRAYDLIPGLAATTWMASLISAEVACRLIEDGTAARLARQQREEFRKRQALAAEILGGHQFRSLPSGLHVWLMLPECWRAEGFVAELNGRGVAVTPAEAFVVGHGGSPHAVRVSLGGATPSRVELQRGLETLAGVLREKPSAASFLVL